MARELFQDTAFKDASPAMIDRDPSGIDMTRDDQVRASLFARDDITVKRLALNRDQIDRYRPRPNPAKMTDSRFGGYAAQHGNSSWELDALEPRVINALIRQAVLEELHDAQWQRSLAKEEARKRELRLIHKHYAAVAGLAVTMEDEEE